MEVMRNPAPRLTVSTNQPSLPARKRPMPRKSYDPLADHFARGRIDEAQYAAGREFQKHFAIADKRRLDAPTDSQDAAWKSLAKCYRALGADGSALVNDVLIDAKTTKQIAESRGKTGLDWERYFVRRFRECLNCLVLVFGFSVVRTNPKTANSVAELHRSKSVARQP
jgi:hypothetical protein